MSRQETCGEIQRLKTARKTGHTGNPGKKKGGKKVRELKMVVNVEEVGNCLVDRVCVPSSTGL